MVLAINGGTPVRTKPFPAYVTVGEEEKVALSRVIDSGCLSKYLGAWHPQFMGGVEVRTLEEEWAEHFGAKHAIAVNSATSGLYCAVGAAGLEPGDEVIVSPYTMCASATAPIIYSAIPVFADVEPDCFCLSPSAVEKAITERTKAILAVDLFGQPYDADAINKIAQRHNLLVIEDTAQAPGARLNGRPAGNLADIGVFSLNYHKHIHCGEGGIIVTDDDELAERMCLIRNHAEAVMGPKGYTNLANMVGFNYRMTELEASVARCQLAKLPRLLEKRVHNAAYLGKALTEIPALTMPTARPGAEHVYYVHAGLFDEDIASVPRDIFIDAVRAELPCFELREQEGVKLASGYVKPLYLQPMFQSRIAFGSQGWPFTASTTDQVDYSPGRCPVAEELWSKTLFTQEHMLPSLSEGDMDDVIAAFWKVWEHRSELPCGG
ncbi:MAG: DegT/DnrJ/EryC1/StrS family aminotransferase [Opitutales bacterium]